MSPTGSMHDIDMAFHEHLGKDLMQYKCGLYYLSIVPYLHQFANVVEVGKRTHASRMWEMELLSAKNHEEIIFIVVPSPLASSPNPFIQLRTIYARKALLRGVLDLSFGIFKYEDHLDRSQVAYASTVTLNSHAPGYLVIDMHATLKLLGLVITRGYEFNGVFDTPFKRPTLKPPDLIYRAVAIPLPPPKPPDRHGCTVVAVAASKLPIEFSYISCIWGIEEYCIIKGIHTVLMHEYRIQPEALIQGLHLLNGYACPIGIIILALNSILCVSFGKANDLFGGLQMKEWEAHFALLYLVESLAVEPCFALWIKVTFVSGNEMVEKCGDQKAVNCSPFMSSSSDMSRISWFHTVFAQLLMTRCNLKFLLVLFVPLAVVQRTACTAISVIQLFKQSYFYVVFTSTTVKLLSTTTSSKLAISAMVEMSLFGFWGCGSQVNLLGANIIVLIGNLKTWEIFLPSINITILTSTLRTRLLFKGDGIVMNLNARNATWTKSQNEVGPKGEAHSSNTVRIVESFYMSGSIRSKEGNRTKH